MAIKFGRPIDLRDPSLRPSVYTAPSLDLVSRPRRNRKSEWARRMVRENVVTTDDLIWPLFVIDGDNTRADIASMPGVQRLTVDQVVRDAERAMKLDIPCIALFPFTEASLRDDTSRGVGSRVAGSDMPLRSGIRKRGDGAIHGRFVGLRAGKINHPAIPSPR